MIDLKQTLEVNNFIIINYVTWLHVSENIVQTTKLMYWNIHSWRWFENSYQKTHWKQTLLLQTMRESIYS